MSTWKSQYRIAGGWMWLYDEFVGNGQAAQYASAINNAIGLIGGPHSIVNQGTGLTIDNAHSTALGAGILQWGANGAQQQKWTFTQNSDTSWNIINQYSGMALDNPGYSTANGTQMDQWTVNGGSNQKWWVDQQSGGAYKIWNQSSSCALDNDNSSANGTPLVQWGWNGGVNQLWLLQ